MTESQPVSEEQGPWDTVNHGSLHAVTLTSVIVVGYGELKTLSVQIRETELGIS